MNLGHKRIAFSLRRRQLTPLRGEHEPNTVTLVKILSSLGKLMVQISWRNDPGDVHFFDDDLGCCSLLLECFLLVKSFLFALDFDNGLVTAADELDKVARLVDFAQEVGQLDWLGGQLSV